MSTETPAAAAKPAKTHKNASGYYMGTGRRKTAVARVRLKAGSGKFLVNGRKVEEYFHNEKDRLTVLNALETTGKKGAIDILVRANGGGPTGQAGAIVMGMARALYRLDESLYVPMHAAGFTTRDSRMKERKHYGLRGARRGTQFSKR